MKLCQIGEEQCPPGYTYGPAVRDHWLIHIVLTGSGLFQMDSSNYAVCGGQGFINPPGVPARYRADMENPWRYAWFGLEDADAEGLFLRIGLSRDRPVFMLKNVQRIHPSLQMLSDASGTADSRDLHALSRLFAVLGVLMEEAQPLCATPDAAARQMRYVTEAADYLRGNHSRPVRIQEVADHLGLDRSYLGSLFHEITGLPMQQWLLRHRVARACELLRDASLQVADVARSVGYADPLQFSRMFHRIAGISPTAWRQNPDAERVWPIDGRRLPVPQGRAD